jgi:predicted lipoprotein with Yx(FWY)xxD motif
MKPKLPMFLANSAGTLMFLSGCSNETTNLVPAAPTPDVSLATTAFGQVLTGANGKTLYFFASDVQGKSECTGNCTTNWPAYTKENPTLGAGLVASDFSTITKADGSKQTLYKGWPLYYYVGDTKAGDTNGEKIGNVWFVAKTKYSIFYANTQLVGNDGKNYLGDYTPGDGKTVYLIDAAGRTLYGFMNDKKNTNAYTKADFSNNTTWPIAELDVPTDLPSNLSASDFSTVDVFGKKQLVFRGHPLYYFGADNAQKGANKGISVPKPGVWPVYNSATAAL